MEASGSRIILSYTDPIILHIFTSLTRINQVEITNVQYAISYSKVALQYEIAHSLLFVWLAHLKESYEAFSTIRELGTDSLESG